MPFTTNYGWNVPDVFADADTWGAELNVTIQDIDAAVNDIATVTSPTFSGTVTANAFAGNITYATPRSFSLAGTVTAAAVSYNGSANVSLNTAIADGALSIAKTDGLQTALNGKQKTITISSSAPTGGVNGDIWLQY